jgi:hypothetical protein
MLVIVYDEHGGFFDHVGPPSDGEEYEGNTVSVPNPDGKHSDEPAFDFRRLGVRVPAVIVSPWVDRGVDHTVFEHSSIPATIRQLFGLNGALTHRDASASTFDALANRQTMRNDTPEKLPRPLSPPKRRLSERRLLGSDTTEVGRELGDEQPLNDLQKTLLDLAEGLDPTRRGVLDTPGLPSRTETAAAARVNREVRAFLGE